METKQIKTSYSTTAGTAYITFDNVRVPVENTLSEVGGGIFVIVSGPSRLLGVDVNSSVSVVQL